MKQSEIHRAASLRNIARATELNRKRVASLPLWRCANCGLTAPATVHQRRHTYCSKSCMAKAYAVRLRGVSNPNFRAASERICDNCDKIYHSYQKPRRFCSFWCYVNSEGYVRGRARKDANHSLLVETLRKLGSAVLDLSHMGRGVPDLAVLTKKGIQLAEIKSPNCRYGKDLSELQKKWADEWRGTSVFIIRTVEDAENLVAGNFDCLQGRGGFKALEGK